MPDHFNRAAGHRPDPRRDRDDALLADLTAPPSLEDAQEAYDFWSTRRAELPRRRRHDRKEAEQMQARWRHRLAMAHRERYGPSLLDQLLDTLGLRWRPNPRRIIAGLTVVALLTLAVLIALIALVVVFWPEIGPVVRSLLNSGNGGG